MSIATDVTKTTIEKRSRTKMNERERRTMIKIQSVMRMIGRESTFFKSVTPTDLPRFEFEEIDIGNFLGQGEFGDVFEINSFSDENYGPCDCVQCLGERQHSKPRDNKSKPPQRMGSKVGFAEHSSMRDCAETEVLVRTRLGSIESQESDEGSHNTSHLQLDKAYMQKHCFRNGSPRFALKRVRCDTEGDWKLGATLDLAKEAKFLACLNHPNIIKMRGTLEEPGHADFGIVLDRMVTTLDKAILQWSKENKKNKFTISKRRWCDSNALELKRLLVLYDISRAMRYLHKHNICYRDLKPENIGFDVRGTVKLFDFGLAKEVLNTEGFEMTGLTGSRRYMAPEVALCEDYGLSADVFSYGILFWSVAALAEPFRTYSPDKHFREVVIRGRRPAICSVVWLPANMRLLMVSCWRPHGTKRPTFSQVGARLRGEISKREGGSKIKDRSVHLMDQSWGSRHGTDLSFDE